MAANTACLVGMVQGLASQMDDLIPNFPFEYAHHNFYRGAQFGLDAVLLWPSAQYPSPRERPVCDLALEMLPVAERGLSQLGVEAREINRMLQVIRTRIERRSTGARWQRRMLDHLEQRASRRQAVAHMLDQYLEHTTHGCPVGEWSVPDE